MKLKEWFGLDETWVQGTWDNCAGQYCLVGGARSLYGETNAAPMIAKLHGALIDVCPVARVSHGPEAAVDDLVNWNDAPGRTREEVAALCEIADV